MIIYQLFTVLCDQVKETLGVGKQESSGFSGTSANHGANMKDGSKASSGEENYQQSASGETAETLFSKFKSSLPSQKVSLAFQKFKEAKITDLAKKGYDIVKDELSGTTSNKKHLQHNPSTSTGERSTKTDIVIVPLKQSPWSKKWEAFKEKVNFFPCCQLYFENHRSSIYFIYYFFVSHLKQIFSSLFFPQASRSSYIQAYQWVQ